MAGCPGLDEKHGFLRVVERNQVSRDISEKEKCNEKRRQAEKMTFAQERGNRAGQTKSKRSAQKMYVPPGRRQRDAQDGQRPGTETSPRAVASTFQTSPQECKDSEMASAGDGESRSNDGDSGKKAHRRERTRTPLFKMEVELEDGRWRAFVVHKEDDAEKIATKFGSKYSLSADIQRALEYKVRQEMETKLTISQ